MQTRLRLLEERLHEISSLLEKGEIKDEQALKAMKREMEVLKIEIQTLRQQFVVGNFRDR